VTRIKVCGLTRIEDARAAEAAGAHWIGAVLVPDTPRRIGPDDAARLANAVSLPLAIVVADVPAGEAADAALRSGARAIQLHGMEDPGTLLRLREMGDWELWKAVRVRSGDDALAAAREFAEAADLLLLDRWDPLRLGGTGAPFDWDEVGLRRAEIPLPLGVAGGLDPENVADAIRRLRPDLVDASSGLESAPGIKDPDRIRAFVHAVEQVRDLRSNDPPSNEP
jgi:phosphoribosylanthranilate isomerase